MNTLSQDELIAQAKAQGVPWLHVAAVCPMCGTVQSMASLVAAGAGKSEEEVSKYFGFSCVGRWANAGPPDRKRPPGKGCNWTLGGLLHLHKLEVITPDGNHHPHFELATPEQAVALMNAHSVPA